MNPEPPLTNPEDFSNLLRSLRNNRRQRKTELKKFNLLREPLSNVQRREILAKTGGRCHICGGEIEGTWHADHVLAHSGGGGHSPDNYLPAHALCNNYRWDYSSEEFQHILKLGVWIRTQIENSTTVGQVAAKGFVAYEAARLRRRKIRPPEPL